MFIQDNVEQGMSFEEHWKEIFGLVKDSDEYLEDPEGTKEYEYDLFVQCQEEHEQQMQLCPQGQACRCRV